MQGRKYKKGRVGDRYRSVKIDKLRNEQRIKKEYNKIRFLAFFLLALLTITIGSSYAFFKITYKSNKTSNITVGTLDITFREGDKINITNATPMSDAEGMTVDSYTFSIENTGNLTAKYNILLEENGTNTLDKEYIKYSYKKQNREWSEPTLLSEGLTIESNKILSTSTKVDYEIKIWLTEDAPNEVQGKEFNAKIVVSSAQEEVNENLNNNVTSTPTD